MKMHHEWNFTTPLRSLTPIGNKFAWRWGGAMLERKA